MIQLPQIQCNLIFRRHSTKSARPQSNLIKQIVSQEKARLHFTGKISNVSQPQTRIQSWSPLSGITELIDRFSDFAFGRQATQTYDEGENIKPLRVEAKKKNKYELTTPAERDFFQFSVKTLVSLHGRWTFSKYQKYHKALGDYIGIDKIGAKIYSAFETIPVHEEMRVTQRIFDSMTPYELQRKSVRSFTFRDRLLIAEAAKVSPEEVFRFMLNFDILRTDRTWYIRLIEMGRALPSTAAEKRWLGDWDRPMTFNWKVPRFSPLESFIQMDEHRKKLKKQPSGDWLRMNTQDRRWPLIRSKGFNRWATIRNPWSKVFNRRRIILSRRGADGLSVVKNPPNIKKPVK